MSDKPEKKSKKKPKYISGIHNYCDRWCERCAFTARCRNFDPDDLNLSEKSDIDNEKLWKKVADNMRKAVEMIKKAAEKHGLDLSEVELTLEDIEHNRLIEEKIKTNTCAVQTKNYSEMARKWIKTHRDLFAEKQDELKNQLEMGYNPEELKGKATEIKEAVEIIQWYMFFIHIKTMRALNSREEYEKDEEDEFPKDSDGSAKVVLVACERSIGAWALLLNEFNEEEDSILKILALLENIIKFIEQEFPDARAFHRPGFDD